MRYRAAQGQVRWGILGGLGILLVAACSTNTDGGFASSGGTGGTIAGGGTGSGSVDTSVGSSAPVGSNATGGTSGSTAAATNWIQDLFGCKFVWGAPYYEATPDVSYLNFVSAWVGQEPNGGLSSWSGDPTVTNPGTGGSCAVCEMVAAVASTKIIPTFYTYVIGGQAKLRDGYGDCNTSTGDTLCTKGAQWIRDNRAQVVNAYAQYAKMLATKFPTKPMIWWLEGDYHQYAESTTQSNALTYPEAGQLAADITTAIKTNQPLARVGMNHAPWISDAQAQQFWSNMPNQQLDLIWVQGSGDTDKFPNSWTDGTSNYAWLHQKTGLPIMAETSYGAPDRWTTATADNVNARIASGVIGVLVNFPKAAWSSPADFASKTAQFANLNSTCP